MRKALVFLALIICLSVFVARPVVGDVQSLDLTYASRGVKVPATLVLPKGEGPFPLVVILHGHGDSRNEPGFVNVAFSLASQGIASFRMDFPGCGDSTEDFSLNTQSNMKQDVINGLTHVIHNYPIDTDNVGAFGYSMGGRLTLELIAEDSFRFKSIVLLAPAADTDNLRLLFGGRAGWDQLKKEAESSTDGVAIFTTWYGRVERLSRQWFADLERYEGNSLATEAAGKFAGPSLVIYSINDEAVAPGVSEAVADVLKAQVVVAPAGGHNYGSNTNDKMILELVKTATTAFFMYSYEHDRNP